MSSAMRPAAVEKILCSVALCAALLGFGKSNEAAAQPAPADRAAATSMQDGIGQYATVIGFVEAVDIKANTLRVDGRIHRFEFEGDFLRDSRGEKVPIRDVIGRRVSIDYLGRSAPGKEAFATHVFVLVDE